VARAAMSGVASAGLASTALPAASAAAIWPVKMASGKFHGLMQAIRPRGGMGQAPARGRRSSAGNRRPRAVRPWHRRASCRPPARAGRKARARGPRRDRRHGAGSGAVACGGVPGRSRRRWRARHRPARSGRPCRPCRRVARGCVTGSSVPPPGGRQGRVWRTSAFGEGARALSSFRPVHPVMQVDPVGIRAFRSEQVRRRGDTCGMRLAQSLGFERIARHRCRRDGPSSTWFTKELLAPFSRSRRTR
jgi:hypothetical protein